MPSKMSVRKRAIGGRAKFARFRTLKNSARNCTLKLSDILLIELFLNTEKSRFIRPGPERMFRPELPRRLKHCSGGAAKACPLFGWAFGGFLFAYDGQPALHLASNDARAALGAAQGPPPSTVR